MDHHFKGLIAALALSAGPAFAGYAQLSPPAGWSAAGGPGGSITGTAANNAAFLADNVRTSPSLNVGGRSVSIQATSRFAANAPRIAAGAVMLHPGIRTAVSIAGWLGVAGLVYDATSGLWTVPDPDAQASDGYEWAHACVTGGCGTWQYVFPTKAAAIDNLYSQCMGGYQPCQKTANGILYTFRQNEPLGASRNVVLWTASSCPAGWYVTPAGCVQTPPPKTLTQDQAIDEIIKHPMPAEVPRHIPEPLPIDMPYIEPVFIPTGDPISNPSFQPTVSPSPANPPMVQPGLDVKPAPAPGLPWQVSTTPVNRPVVDPNAPPVREPTPLPPGQPSPNQPKDPDKSDLCQKYPNIIACQELKDEPDDTKLPTKAIEFEFNPIPGFQGAKSCPAFPHIGNALGGRQISWQPFCDQLSRIANLLLALAWLYAAWIIYSSRD